MERGGNLVINWYPQKFQTKLQAHIGRNLNMAAITLTNAITNSFGSSGVTGTRGGATKKDRATNRSMPWGPPNVDTEHLKRNIGYDTPVGSPFTRRVGTSIGNKQSVGYAMWLEFGTRKMLPRPFLRPMLYKMGKELRRLITLPMN